MNLNHNYLDTEKLEDCPSRTSISTSTSTTYISTSTTSTTTSSSANTTGVLTSSSSLLTTSTSDSSNFSKGPLKRLLQGLSFIGVSLMLAACNLSGDGAPVASTSLTNPTPQPNIHYIKANKLENAVAAVRGVVDNNIALSAEFQRVLEENPGSYFASYEVEGHRREFLVGTLHKIISNRFPDKTVNSADVELLLAANPDLWIIPQYTQVHAVISPAGEVLYFDIAKDAKKSFAYLRQQVRVPLPTSNAPLTPEQAANPELAQAKINPSLTKTQFKQFLVEKPSVLQDTVVNVKVTKDLYSTLLTLGASEASAKEILRLLSWKTKNTRFNGAMVSAVVQREYVEGKPYGNTNYNLQAIKVRAGKNSYYAFFDRGWYDENGNRNPKLHFQRYPTEQVPTVTSHFNPERVNPVTGKVIPHSGTDFRAKVGTNLIAPADGKVVATGENHEVMGKFVIIEHEQNYRTIYVHLSQILVKTGQQVYRDNLIGKTGATGRATGPHLHYEVRIDGEAFDPMKVELPKVNSVSETPEFQLLKAKYLSLLK